MDRAALQGFVVVAQEGSFTAAARRLVMTQPALTKQVQRLEAQLGVRLLERSPSGVGVTVAGAAVLQTAVHLFDVWAQLLAGLGCDPTTPPAPDTYREEGPVRVGTFTSDISDLAQLLSIMLAPARVQLTRHTRGELLSAVAEGRLDAAFTHANPGQRLPVPPGVQVRTIVRVPIWALLGSNHPLADRESVSVADLNRAGTTWYITPESDTYSWDLDYLNADPRQPAQTLEMSWNGRTTLEDGDGAALVTASAVPDHPAHVAVPLLPEASASYLLVWRPPVPETTAGQLLAALRAYHRYRAHHHTRYWHWIHQHPTSFPGIALPAPSTVAVSDRIGFRTRVAQD